LNHKVLDHTVKLYSIEGVLLDELQVVISMNRGLIEELDDEVPLGCLYENLRTSLALRQQGGAKDESRAEGKKRTEELSHRWDKLS
jgi:hypothetical protein